MADQDELCVCGDPKWTHIGECGIAGCGCKAFVKQGTRCEIGAIIGTPEEREAFEAKHPDVHCSEPAVGMCECGKPACAFHLNKCMVVD